MKKTEVIKLFVTNQEYPWADYQTMINSWGYLVDYLVDEGSITDRQALTWKYPTTEDKYKSWVKKHFTNQLQISFPIE